MSKKSHFRGSFDNQHGKRAETLVKSERKHLHHIYWSLWRESSGKNSLLVICKILGLFVNPLTANDKYSLLNRDNLFQHLEMQLFRKRKTFGEFFLVFLKFKFNLKDFQKRDDSHSWCISELTHSQKRG